MIFLYRFIRNIMTKIELFGCSFNKRVIHDRSGMGTIEVIIIIAVLVALALIFRNFIMELASGIFDKIRDKTDSTIDGL